ncbi:MAG: gfo/Idh/MocA family oxidoreductase [Acidobacteria bacterium]|nr:MAG: gfo/Idh/MocA family oxidoreductase [Acidobacteriota bacterium]
MRNLTAAVVGAGFIGPVHVEGLMRAGVPVAGILGISDEESNRAAAALNLPRAYRSFAEVLADPEVDVVHIATPNILHYDMARQVLKAGKHVLCEKPLAMNTRESAELVDVAHQSGLVAGVNYNIRFYPLCIEARDIVRRGDLGEVFSICGSYAQDWLLLRTDYNWRVLAEAGGDLRAVADIGTHWLDLVQHITGLEVEAVCADLKTVHPTRLRPKGEVETFKGKQEIRQVETEPIAVTTEDFGSILLRFSTGARGCLWVSQVTAGRKNCLRFEIAGSRSAVSWSSEDPNQLWIGHRERPNEALIRDPALVSEAARRFINYPGGHNEGFPDTFKQCFRAFYGYIRAGDFSAATPFPTFEDGHREIAVCEAILRSHREARWVELNSK